MGIQGLLPFLKKIHDPVNIAKFAGCTVAIDAYCWLHKGAFSCAEKLVLGEKTDQYVYYCMKYLEYMLKNNLKPIMVFDGCHLPSKEDVEKNRREKRDMYRKKAAQLLREGNRSEARECLQRCIDISPEMALRLMEVCRERGVDCIVAPYEADAQLAFLSKSGIAQVIVTEDSDLLLFGCDRVIFKMDHFGNGMMIEKSRLNEVLEIQNGFYTFDKFRYMCILSGCDYLPSLTGIGLVKACKVFKLARQTDLRLLLKKFPTTYLKMSLTVSEEYIDGFIRADNTFLYQLVFDPLSRKIVPLNDYQEEMDINNMKYAGPYMSHIKAYQIALGNINIYTMEKFADFNPDTFVPNKVSKKKPDSSHMLSIWNKNYKIRPKIQLTETQNRPNLKGKEVVIKSNILKTEVINKPMEECEEVKSDKELSGIYLDSPIKQKNTKKRKLDVSSSDEEPTPPKKHQKYTKSPRKQNKEFDSSDEEPIPVKKYQKFTKSPRKPEFIDSLVDADNVSDSPKEDKENNIKSPRNRFAVFSPTKKPKFNLNAPKEVVKSRFFASSPMVKTEPNDPDMSVKESAIVQNSSTKIGAEEVQNSPKMEEKKVQNSPKMEEKEEIIKSNEKPKQVKPSSKSAFSWSKFKLTKQPSSIESSPCSRNPFKRVSSDTNISSSLSRTESQQSASPITRTDSQQSVTSVCRTESQKSIDTLSQISSHSNLYSIDSDCLPNMEDVDECCHSNASQNEGQREDTCDNKLQPPSQDKVDLKDDNDDDMIVIKSEIKTNSTDFKKVKEKEKKKASLMSGCRVSGLSRGKKNSPAVDSTQKSLKDMFAKFSNDKNKNLPKIKHDKNELSGTPSSDNTVLSVKGGIQRCLLPS